MKRLISLVCLVAMLTAFVGGAALAATRYNTKLTISYSRASGGHFSGKVKAQKHACITGRKVTVYRRKRGHDPAVGSGKSSASGRWKINPAGRVAAGNYYAKTPPHQLGAGLGTCTAARSITTHAS
jgi:hypothetical protein